jgi:flagellar protein FlgJ
MHQMLKEMRKTVKKTGLIHGGQAEEIFSDMLDQERSKTMTIGLGDMLFMQLSKAVVPSKRPLK